MESFVHFSGENNREVVVLRGLCYIFLLIQFFSYEQKK